MSFVSGEFFAIIISTIVLYFICPKRFRWYVLLLASGYFYYVAAGWIACIYALVTIAVTYFAGIYIEKNNSERKKSRFYLIIACIICIGFLALVKVQKFMKHELVWLAAPLGISYYTFSLVGYLSDIYYKKGQVERNYLKLVLYTLYFPKIMQGPISKYREIGPRLIEGHSFDYTRMCFGLQRMMWGFFKKIVIADRAAILTKPFFEAYSSYKGGGAVLVAVTLLATVRHYCDFSGYMDIVIGLSEIMGIELEDNFKQPFFSKNAAEFWRRWHITLGVWFKDYVYMPLVISPKLIKLSGKVRKRFGKRPGKAVLTVIPLLCVWTLTGIWHGTGIDYILWGLYWGTIIIISNVFAPEIKKLTTKLKINTEAADWKLFQMLRTFAIFVVGLLISTFVGFKGLRHYGGTVLKRFWFHELFEGKLLEYGLSENGLRLLLAAILVLLIGEILQTTGSVRAKIAGLHALPRWIIYATGLFVLILFGIYGAGYDGSDFAYMFF